MDILTKHVRQWAASRFDWSRHNCAIAVMRYVEEVAGRAYPHDFAASDEDGARAWLHRRGGIVKLAEEFAAYFDAIEVAAPKMGDFGVIRPADRAICGVCVGTKQWAYVADTGVIIGPTEVVKAWRLF